MIRAAVILGLVVALTLGARSFLPAGALAGSGASLAFGFFLIAALQVGHIFDALRLPHLTGYILCGFVFGPEVVGLVTPAMMKDLTLVKRVAVGLIGLLAGSELNFRALLPRLRDITAYTFGAMLTMGALLFALFLGVATYLPATRALPLPHRAVVALLCSNALCAFSPPVVIGILAETRAAGPLTTLAVPIVVVADLIIAVAFALVNVVAHATFPGAGGASGGWALVVHIFGSLGVGAAVGAVLAIYVRRAGRRIGLFVFGVLFVVAEAGHAFHIDPLLVGLAAGLFLENVSPVSGGEVAAHTEPAALPTFAVFFAVIGAEVHVHAFLAVAPFALAAALTRAAGIFAGARLLGGALARARDTARWVPFAMLPQAGIALALATLIKTSYPGWGESVGTILLGTVVVNEMLGPVLLRAAVVRAGEAGKKEGDAPHEHGHG